MPPLNLEKLTFRGPHGPIDATLARPAGSGPFPGVLLLQEGIGVTGHLVALAKRLAEAGFITFVPDLYSRDLVRRALRDEDVIRALPLARAPNRAALIAALPQEQQESARQVVAWFEGRDSSTYLADAQAALQFLRHHKAALASALASVGFSLGGGLTAQLAGNGVDLAAGVIFYGQGPSLEQLPKLRFPLLGHYAEDDPAITPQVAALDAQLKAAGKSFINFVYPGTEHGFFNDARPTYRREAAELAYRRTLEFLNEHLVSRRASRQAGARL